MSEKSKAIIPPERWSVVRTRVEGDMNLHRLMDMVGAPDFDSIPERAQTFEITIPLCPPEEEREWGDAGSRWTLREDIVFNELRRIDREMVGLRGHFLKDLKTSPRLLLTRGALKLKYQIGFRGTVDIPRAKYMELIQSGRDKGYFL